MIYVLIAFGISVPVVLFCSWYFWRDKFHPTKLYIRHRDRAIFVKSPHSRIFHRVSWVHGRFIITSETWLPENRDAYDVVAYEYVASGCRVLAERGET